MTKRGRIGLLLAALALLSAGSAGCQTVPRGSVTFQQLADLPAPPADHRIEYGTEPSQFGELRVPPGEGPYPVALLIHGGCWSTAYDLSHLGAAAEELLQAGVATWAIEYRRLGEAGGGFPGTFHDVAAGADHLRTIADSFNLDLERVVAVGHSAGGHLALWLAARDNLHESSELWHPTPLPLSGVVALAAISDLAAFASGPGGCNAAALELIATPQAGRYREMDPAQLLPLWVPIRLVHGELDPIIPIAQSEAFMASARAAGDDAALELIPNAGHFDLIAPIAPAWESVEAAILEMLGR